MLVEAISWSHHRVTEAVGGGRELDGNERVVLIVEEQQLGLNRLDIARRIDSARQNSVDDALVDNSWQEII